MPTSAITYHLAGAGSPVFERHCGEEGELDVEGRNRGGREGGGGD